MIWIFLSVCLILCVMHRTFRLVVGVITLAALIFLGVTLGPAMLDNSPRWEYGYSR